MIAIGCLAPLILGVLGGLAGNAVAGPDGALLGLAAGFATGGALLGAAVWLVAKAKS